jgi:hypothetical protein
MAESIALVGPSGSGKTFSLRNLNHEETFVFSPYKPTLSIPGAKAKYSKYDTKENTGNFMLQPNMQILGQWVKYIAENRPEIKNIVIEDFSHYMTYYLMSADFRGKGGGKMAYSRFEEFAHDAYTALFANTPYLRDDLMIIYIFHDDHVENMQGGFRKIRVTAGKMLDEKIDLPSYFNYVLFSEVSTDKDVAVKDRFLFRIVNDGYTPAKLPPGLYDEDVEVVNNDIVDVLQRIEKYNFSI